MTANKDHSDIDFQPGELIDENEIAAILDVSVCTLRNWRWKGEGEGPKYRKIGRLVRYARTDLARFIGEAQA
jgi:predicted DNA-binding transcriptional regulator AlpA